MRYLILTSLFLAGCAASDSLAVLQNPKTGQTVQCKMTEDDVFTADPLGHCIRAYEKAGFVRIDDTTDAKKP